jgi:hypothetical protein
MKTTLPDLDDSRSPFAPLVASKYGFPADSLRALYLMTGQHSDGALISGGNVTDYSGLANHASYQVGGNAYQRSWGQDFVDNGGGIITPIPVNASYTTVLVARQTHSEGPTTARFPVFSAPSSALAATTASFNSPTANGLYLTEQMSVAGAGKLDLGLFVRNSEFDGDTSPRKGVVRDLVSSMSFFAMAVSVNFETNVINFVSSAGSYSITDADVSALVEAGSGFHSFGLFRLDTQPLPGALCLAAIHNVAYPMESLKQIFANARRLVRRRGVEVV